MHTRAENIYHRPLLDAQQLKCNASDPALVWANRKTSEDTVEGSSNRSRSRNNCDFQSCEQIKACHYNLLN
jgi:hypothetical protein